MQLAVRYADAHDHMTDGLGPQHIGEANTADIDRVYVIIPGFRRFLLGLQFDATQIAVPLDLCGELLSLHALYSKQDHVLDSALEGRWEDDKSEVR
jgi:hypothetical protein